MDRKISTSDFASRPPAVYLHPPMNSHIRRGWKRALNLICFTGLKKIRSDFLLHLDVNVDAVSKQPPTYLWHSLFHQQTYFIIFVCVCVLPLSCDLPMLNSSFRPIRISVKWGQHVRWCVCVCVCWVIFLYLTSELKRRIYPGVLRPINLTNVFFLTTVKVKTS